MGRPRILHGPIFGIVSPKSHRTYNSMHVRSACNARGGTQHSPIHIAPEPPASSNRPAQPKHYLISACWSVSSSMTSGPEATLDSCHSHSGIHWPRQHQAAPRPPCTMIREEWPHPSINSERAQ
ncbi:hypothetical protein OBBRIDRAFT_42441 [Obba rivulosa]|uniref:Uncharacterized protein n=1 Tax=Obba rivulosa TaxID=1052685 RepID=A0A8E2AVY3_9APHY|nr:hypothetical protein OBBRIDRAFT_42441 [Obba rivulosa]